MHVDNSTVEHVIERWGRAISSDECRALRLPLWRTVKARELEIVGAQKYPDGAIRRRGFMGKAEDAARRRSEARVAEEERRLAEAKAQGAKFMPQLNVSVAAALRTLEQHDFPSLTGGYRNEGFMVRWQGEDYIAWTLVRGGGYRIYLLSTGAVIFHDLDGYIREYGEEYIGKKEYTEIAAGTHGPKIMQLTIKALGYLKKAKFRKLPLRDDPVRVMRH